MSIHSSAKGAAAYPGEDGSLDREARFNPSSAEEDPLLQKLGRLQNRGLSKLERRRRAAAKRKDSFYFLQHAMRRKDIERNKINSLQTLEDDEAEGFFSDDEDDDYDDDDLRHGGGGGGRPRRKKQSMRPPSTSSSSSDRRRQLDRRRA